MKRRKSQRIKCEKESGWEDIKTDDKRKERNVRKETKQTKSRESVKADNRQ